MEKMGKSFIRKIILMMGALLLLNAAILGMVWGYSNNVLEENVDAEVSHLLNVYAGALENSLAASDMNLLNIAQEQSSLEELSSPSDTNRYYAAVHLLELVKRLRSNNDGVDMLLAAGNYEDSVSDASARMKLTQRDEIISFMEQRREERKTGGRAPTGTSGWVLQQVGDTLYLTRIYDTQEYSVSAWVKTESLAAAVRKLEEDGERYLFLTDSEGNCIGEVSAGSMSGPAEDKKQSRQWSRPVGTSGMELVCLVEKTDIYGQMPLISALSLAVIFGMMGLLCWLLLYLRQEIFQPIRELMETISWIRLGDYRHRIVSRCKNKEFIALNQAFNSMMDTIVQLRIREYEKQIRLSEAELKYFQMQIRPHFFLNAMATIHSMSFENRNEDIRAFIAALSKNVRYMFKAGLHTVPLKEEWEHLENYFEMQELLYPGCVFYFIEKRPEAENWRIPQMILHTFMENKYKHSVRAGELLSVYVDAQEVTWKEKRALQITIEDDGAAFPEEIVTPNRQSALKADGSGVGLLNVEKTLEIMYGEKGLLCLENAEEGGTRITLVILEHTILEDRV
ncbi:MAG: histidine kinase [Eubacteriales bacterium]|nr:histidine kinase [Eubacteriales bacterium]